MKTKLLLLLLLANFSIYAQINLVQNSGFETWTGNIPQSWTVANSVISNADFASGQWSAKLSYTTVSPKITTQVPMKAGVTYTVKYKYKYIQSNYGGDHPIALNISKAGSSTTLSSSTFATNNLWTSKETTFTPDADLSYDLSFSTFSFDSATFYVLIDDVEVYVKGTEQYTLIPNVEFEKRLINLGLDSGATDGKVLTSNIAFVTSLDIDTNTVSDLTGIQDFIALKTLNCSNFQINQGLKGKLTKLDVTKNVNLTTLRCSDNELTSLDVSKNVLLTDLDFTNNKVTTIDLSKNTALSNLDCYYNSLTALDLSKNTALKFLDCYTNQITSLDVSKNILLQDLMCYGNQITALDLSKNTSLKRFNCYSNQLTTLNLKNGKNTLITSITLSGNPKLSCIIVDDVDYANTNWSKNKDADVPFYPFECSTITPILDPAFETKLIALGIDTDGKNGVVLNSSIAGITSLDVSGSSIINLSGLQGFTSLQTLNVSNNLLKKLDLSKNTAITILNCSQNSSLTCIQVANLTTAATWATTKDAIASFSLDCNFYTTIPDSKFEDKLIALKIDKDGKNGKVNTESIADLTSLDVSNSGITDLTGIQDFKSLKSLKCNGSSGSAGLTKLDISKNTQLTDLTCTYHQITAVDVSKNTLLKSLSVGMNKITAIDVSANTALTLFSVAGNQLTTIDVTKNTALETLALDMNKLSTVDVSQNTKLKTLYLSINALTSVDISKNTDLTYLYVSSNKLSTVDISKNTALEYLDISSNQLSTIDVTQNVNLNYARVYSNTLTTLDVTKNTLLKNLNCSNNKLSTLDVSKNTVLTDLDANTNLIAALNVSNNLSLAYLDLYGNPITSIDVTKNTALNYLSVSGTKITTLDLSKNVNLKTLYCPNNKLTNVNLKNGKNTLLTTVSFLLNPDLKCILVDDANYSAANWKNKDVTSYYSNIDCSLTTYIADSTFEDKLIALGIDTDGKNGVVLTANIKTITSLDVSNSSIKDLTGIEGFTALTNLNSSNNALTNLDLSKNAALNTLNTSNNASLTCIKVADVVLSNNWTVTKDAIASFSLDCRPYTQIPDLNFEKKLIALGIDTDGENGKILTSSISSLTSLSIANSAISDLTGIADFKALKTLTVSRNNLKSLDISKNSSLTNLNCDSNQLKNIDISKNVSLYTFSASNNLLTNLDITKNTDLSYLTISNNNLTTIDLSKNLKMWNLDINSNALTALDVSKNIQLYSLRCYFNQITTLDLSKNVALNEMLANNNKLVNVNIKNGKNTLLLAANNGGVRFMSNPNLTCIQVDDVNYSNTNWKNQKDASAVYSTDACPVNIAYTLIPDANFENKLIALGIDKDGKNGKVATASISSLTTVNVSNSGIADLTGIEDFASLNSLDCSKNQLTGIVLYSNKALTSLNCSNNQLSDINTTVNTLLAVLNFSSNNILTFDASKNLQLTALSASFNKLNTLDVSKNTALKQLDCAGNNMYNLNLKNGNNANMQNMIFGNFTENPNLLCIQVDDAAFSNNNWIAKDATANYSSAACAENLQYTSIPDPIFENELIESGIDKDGKNGKVLTASIRNITSLTAIDLVNKVTDLTGIEDFSSLVDLHIYHGAITKLDVSKNLKLKILDMADNKVSTLDLSKNTALETLSCGSNNLTQLIVANNTALTELSASNNQLTSIDVSKNKALTKLSLGTNQLTNIDITANTALTSFDIYKNKVTSIDVSKNTALTTLGVSDNLLSSIDLSKNTTLTTLSLSNNPWTSVDISKNTILSTLYVTNCQLTNIDLSSHIALKVLEIAKNKLTTLDLSKNTALTSVIATSNELTSLNLKNGKNTLLINGNVSFSSNPKLFCILVDDVNYANTNWLNRKDAIATYNTECTGELTLPANNFTVETKGESCLGENNGEISITAKTALDYTATINDKPYSFANNSLKVTALTPGVYKIKITVPNTIFEQNFNITIAKGATITGKSSITAKKVDVEITEGTAPFTVFVDGTEQFQTTDSNFSIALNEGGLIEVATAKACEGVYAKKIKTTEILGTVLSAYPNPTKGNFEIEIPTDKNEVVIELYNFGGQLVSRKSYVIENGTAKLSLENQPSGIYAAKIYLETPEYIKIIKK
ncbi:T9SS type A sorting domain-containing protein [Flavobacterium sp. MDT1-60]|uniref:T9SS type A sorting domain-containing protein n=1 Tax=Flavobacterium sp. MDT1-60 TaxID=1979344 RepID=UPI0017859B71|nr:T9SS type A sorting domain-containing protein [Flavobacterium sp. MDT1-60]QOG02970.1 leucine-rich repeat domain-containing protein [Flavobacterium sp. MDT1-60]